jgi:hypothetical protein
MYVNDRKSVMNVEINPNVVKEYKHKHEFLIRSNKKNT